MDLLEGLNEVQQQIVQDTEGNLLVLAGAGSGKTRVLTRRIAYLMYNNVPAWQILAVTFTNKAAKEMKQRVIDISGPEARDAWIGTFHGTCVRILTRFGSEIGIEKFTIIDSKEQEKVLKEAIALTGLDYEASKVGNVISDAKNALLTPDSQMAVAQYQHDKDFAQIYQAYEDRKTEHQYLDYDDLIMKTVHLLQVSSETRDVYQRQFRYVLTDETQDTNKAQFELLTLLTGHHGNLFAVGDTDQSIYGWRGAEIQNIIKFERYFPDTKVYRLEQNYRSTKTIVNASNAVILNNKERLEKTAFSDGAEGQAIVLYTADNDAYEANFVRDIIRATVRRDNRKWSDFAVLYRTNRQSRAIESAFGQVGMPYQLIGGHAFYDRKEIKDIVAYLRAVSNGVDYIAFERVINVPRRGVGDAALSKIQDYADDCAILFPKALEHIEDIPKLSKKATAGIQDFLRVIGELREYAASEDFSAGELITRVINLTGYKAMLQESNKEEDQSRLENLEELVNLGGKWDVDEDNAGKTLADFLAETSLVADVDKLDDDDAITLMTGHSAKGLEFPIVFLIGLEEGIFPHRNSMGDASQLEEERRLLYVAMTRAEEKLYMSTCKYRFDYGSTSPVQSKPSRFLRELPRELIKQI